MTFTIDKRLLLYLTFTFIIATIIGTLSHECGHYVAARLMGFKAHISYGMTWLVNDNRVMTLRQEFWFMLAGPLQTMLTGTTGFLFLYNSSKPAIRISFGRWGLIFLSLFWLRQSANLVIWFGGYFITGHFGDHSDEIKLSRLMNWSDWSIITVTAFIGIIVTAIIIFKFISKSQRLTFILSGLIGGFSGYLFWLVYFGKLIMP